MAEAMEAVVEVMAVDIEAAVADMLVMRDTLGIMLADTDMVMDMAEVAGDAAAGVTRAGGLGAQLRHS